MGAFFRALLDVLGYFIDDSVMPVLSRIAFLLLLLFGLGLGLSAVAQEKPAEQSASPPALQLNYPDHTGGLERLGKDIIKALKDGDTTHASALMHSLLLPDSKTWYAKIFGEVNAEALSEKYEEVSKDLPAHLEVLFAKFVDEHATSVSAKRFDASCNDDNAGDFTFGVLQARLEPIPLYELRFASGERFYRLWAIAYVGGAFRFVGDLRPPSYFARDNAVARTFRRITIGGNIQAAKVVKRVQPVYPEHARREHLQGTVKLHAIIAKDGSIQDLRVLSGACSLAQASFDAVRQWRYQPTLFNGQPVEVDTTIDVIFALNY